MDTMQHVGTKDLQDSGCCRGCVVTVASPIAHRIAWVPWYLWLSFVKEGVEERSSTTVHILYQTHTEDSEHESSPTQTPLATFRAGEQGGEIVCEEISPSIGFFPFDCSPSAPTCLDRPFKTLADARVLPY